MYSKGKKKHHHWWHRRRRRRPEHVFAVNLEISKTYTKHYTFAAWKKKKCCLCAKIRIKFNIFLSACRCHCPIMRAFPRGIVNLQNHLGSEQNWELEITCNYQTHGLICKCLFHFRLFFFFFLMCTHFALLKSICGKRMFT